MVIFAQHAFRRTLLTIVKRQCSAMSQDVGNNKNKVYRLVLTGGKCKINCKVYSPGCHSHWSVRKTKQNKTFSDQSHSLVKWGHADHVSPMRTKWVMWFCFTTPFNSPLLPGLLFWLISIWSQKLIRAWFVLCRYWLEQLHTVHTTCVSFRFHSYPADGTCWPCWQWHSNLIMIAACSSYCWLCFSQITKQSPHVWPIGLSITVSHPSTCCS